MSVKAYVFLAWAPVGDDCPLAMAAVVAESLRAARTAIRVAGVRMVDKAPFDTDLDTADFDRWPHGVVVWRYANDEVWIPV